MLLQETAVHVRPRSGRSDFGAFNRPELDVVRLFAFLLVFLGHSAPKQHVLATRVLTTGVFGVSLFFVLSAYLITELLQIEKIRTGTIAIRRFYLRRILRIWPLFFLFVGVYWLKGLLQPQYAIPSDLLLALVLFAGNFWTGRHGFFPGPLVPLWSISVEEQFYLLWPGLMLLLSRKGAILFSLLLLPIAALALTVLAHQGADPVDHVWTNSFVQFQAFAFGGLLALWLRGRQPDLVGWQRAALAAVGFGSFVVAQFGFRIHTSVPPPIRNYIAGYLCVDLGACCLLVAALGWEPARNWKALRYLGRISYGMYVFHLAALWAVFHLTGDQDTPAGWCVAVVLAFAVTVVLAAISYRFLESPFVRLKERFAAVPSHTI